MSYPPRMCFEGAIYHITARGNNREAVFRSDDDRRQWLLLLRRYKERFRFKLHAFALMDNHIHLLLEPSGDSTVSHIMQCLTVAYTKYFNRQWTRAGHVFQGRFHSRLVQKDDYFLVVSRYIHLNPVRAGMVRAPKDYLWSSYRAYLDAAANGLRLVDAADVLGLIAPDAQHQRTGYREFVEAATTDVDEIECDL